MTVSRSKPAAFLKLAAVFSSSSLGEHVGDVIKSVGRALFRDLQHRLQAEIAVADDHVVHRGDALVLVTHERVDRIGAGKERGRQHAAIDDRLRPGLRPDRLHRMRGIPDQRDAGKAPARDRIAVHVRQLQHALGAREQALHVEPRIAPALIAIDRQRLVGDRIPGLERRRTAGYLRVGEPVDHHLAARQRRDGIDDGAMGAVADDHHRARRSDTDRLRRSRDSADSRRTPRLRRDRNACARRSGCRRRRCRQISFRFAHRPAGRIGEAGEDLVAALLRGLRADGR